MATASTVLCFSRQNDFGSNARSCSRTLVSRQNEFSLHVHSCSRMQVSRQNRLWITWRVVERLKIHAMKSSRLVFPRAVRSYFYNLYNVKPSIN